MKRFFLAFLASARSFSVFSSIFFSISRFFSILSLPLLSSCRNRTSVPIRFPNIRLFL